MATVNLNGSITLDESSGLQVPPTTATATEDYNDSDVLVSSLPGSFTSRLGQLTSAAIIEAASKADLVSVTLGASETLSSLGFVDSSGNALPVYGSGTGVASGLSAVNGGAISLFADVSSGLGTKMVIGIDTDLNIVLALYMGPGSTATASTMWMALFEPISHPVTTNHDDAVALGGLGVAAGTSLEFNFNALPSGQNLFGTVGSTDAGLVVIGKTPVLNADGTYTNASNTINTSQGGGPTTIGVNNQMFDPGEGAYFTFVKNPTAAYLAGAPDGLNQNEADDADYIQYTGGTLAVSSAFTKISQLQGNSLATMKITAKDISGAPQGKDFVSALGSGDLAAITAVRVFNASGLKIEDTADLANYNAVAVSVSFTSGVATVAGLGAGYRVEWDTSTPHDQVLIEAVAGKFDIGGFGSTQGVTTSQALNVVSYEDDGPSVTLGTPTDTTVLNTQDADTIGSATDSDTKGFAASFSVASSSYGRDGDGTLVGSFALSLGSGAPNSGLTSQGSTIYLYLIGGVVVGSTATVIDDVATARTVFDVSVNSSTGDVTLNQYEEIDHAPPGSTSNYSSQQAVLANDKIILTGTATITDADGDTATAFQTIDLGGNIKFDDDGPTASIARTVNAVTLDETVGAKVGDANAATDDITLSNTDPFAGAYGTPIGALSAVDLVDTTVTTGADGFGATTAVSLAITGGSGASSGLATSDGTAINLYLESNGDVTGRTGSASGAVIFAVKIDGSGNVSVAQYAGLQHPVTTNADDAVDLSGKLSAVVVETDGDADTATDTVGIGDAIVFEDDGPTLAVGNLIGTGTTLAQTGYWAGSTGTDGIGANGVDITLDAFTLLPPVGSPVAGTITSFSEGSPSPDGSGNYHWSGTLAGDFNNNGLADDDPLNFTLTAFADNHYELDLAAPVASTFNFDTANGGLGAGGPDPVQTLYIPKPPATPTATVVFFSALVGATNAQILANVITGSADASEPFLEGPPLADGIDARSMNVSTAGIGVGNNLLQGDSDAAINAGDESFVANPDILCTSVTVNIDNSVGGYSYTGGERLQYRVVYDDGSFSDYATLEQDVGLANKGQQTSFTIQTVAGKLIDAVQITMAKGDVKIPNIVFTQQIESLASSLKLDFTATITDKDGDSACDGFTALLNTSRAVGSLFDFILAGTASVQDAFNVDLTSAKTKWQVSGFDTGTLRDKLVFLGDATATATIDNSDATNSVVTVTESGAGGQTTTVTVVGVDLLATDLVGLASVSVV